jgi:hypothetical protein
MDYKLNGKNKRIMALLINYPAPEIKKARRSSGRPGSKLKMFLAGAFAH